MPTLNHYSDPKRDGLYVLANFGGQHPVTLQVTLIASRIFKLVGYEDGDSVPKKLVDAMYELDMLYTLSSFDAEKAPEMVNPSSVFEDFDILSALTDEERKMLDRHLEQYSGPKEDHVEELREKLLKESDISLEKTEVEYGSNLDHLPTTSTEIKSVFFSWTPKRIQNRAENAFYLCENFIRRSVRTFSTHEGLSDTPICSIEDKEIVYEIEPVRNAERVFVADVRGKQSTINANISTSEFDYRIHRMYDSGNKEIAHILNENVIKHESTGKSGSYLIMSYDVDKIIPPREPSPILPEPTNISSELLIDEYLSIPPNEINTHPVESVDIKDEEPAETGEVSEGYPGMQSKIKAIQSSDNWRAFEVDDISNNGNGKVTLEDTLIVITDIQNVSKGDEIVVRWNRKAKSNHIIINNAEYLSNVPSENPTSWLKAHL